MTEVITNNLNLWTSALLTKSSAGRGSNGKQEAYGIKKLRELILELAVRGKLVPQDNSDEPASVLLETIATTRARLMDEGVIKKQKPLPEITDEDRPYTLPSGWEWERLGNLFDIQDSRRIPVNSAERASREGPYPYYGANGQVGSIDDYLFEGERILIAEDGGFFDDPIRGVAYVVDGQFWVNNHAHVLECLCETNAKYWVAYLNRLNWEPLVRGMTRDKLNQAAMIQIVIAVPPLAEQHRIVAKVDELMALCDQLEQQQTHSIEAHQTLVETLLGTLTRAASPQELTEAWPRIANNFHTLFTTEQSIDQLKQTILQLAVMGKLVPQDPNDEPALALLDQITAHKAALTEIRTLHGSPRVTPLAPEEADFELPPTWVWARFGEIMVNRDGERIPVSKEERATKAKLYDYYGASGVIDKIDSYLFDKPLLLIGEDGANLVNRSTPIAFMARGKYWVNNHAHVLDGISEHFLRYIELHINAINLEPYVTGSAQPKMNQAKMNSIPIALPPLAEQHRIVAKVDELMALCDALKVRLKDAQITQIHLADAIVEQAVA